MQTETSTELQTTQASELTLKKATFDLTSIKSQMVLGLTIILVTCLFSYSKCLSIGFLLDDFLHLDYVARAAHGDWTDFINNFVGNWAGSDIMRSYRPLVSLSFLTDYLVWGKNAAGFHLANILLLFGCSALVSLITLEITGLRGNRLGSSQAIWAGLLFAVYPLHGEAVAWIVGRVDLLCTLFYLASFFAYLRFRHLQEISYYKVSLLLFFLALLSKEMAVTLPFTIALAELFLPEGSGYPSLKQANLKSLTAKFKYAGAFFIVLLAYALFRSALLGTLVGGYGNAGIIDLFHSWKIFFNKPTLLKIVFPLNEEVPISDQILKVLPVCYLGILGIAACRLTMKTCPLRPFLLVASLAPLMVLPTFQIWHIFPNLVGSRLFFLSSAPFSIFLALSALPGIDAMKRREAQATTIMGTVFLFGLFISWATLLESNLMPWIEAGERMSAIPIQLAAIAKYLPEGKRSLLIDLPEDFSGAGMLTRPQYLEILARPPFAKEDLAARFVTVEPPVTGSHAFLWPSHFVQMITHKNIHSTFRYDAGSGQFVRWFPPQGGSVYQFNADSDGISKLSVKDGIKSTDHDWSILSSTRPALIQHQGFISIHPGTHGLDFWLPPVQLNPLEAHLATLQVKLHMPSTSTNHNAGVIRLIWQSSQSFGSSAASRPAKVQIGNALVHDRYKDEYLVWLGRYRSWMLNGTITRLGLHFDPGEYIVDLKQLAIASDTAITPRFHFSPAADPYALWLLKVSPETPIQLTFDATSLPRVKCVRMLISQSGITFDGNNELAVLGAGPAMAQAKLMCETQQEVSHGKFSLPVEIYNYPGIHQARAIALDSMGVPVGLPSEPISLLVSKH